MVNAQKAGLHNVPVVITEADDLKSLEFAIVENVQRHDLNPLEEAQGYKQLIENFLMIKKKTKFIVKMKLYEFFKLLVAGRCYKIN